MTVRFYMDNGQQITFEPESPMSAGALAADLHEVRFYSVGTSGNRIVLNTERIVYVETEEA